MLASFFGSLNFIMILFIACLHTENHKHIVVVVVAFWLPPDPYLMVEDGRRWGYIKKDKTV